MHGEYLAWYEEVRRLTLRLVSLRGVSPDGDGENRIAHEVLELLWEEGLEAAYTSAGLDPLEDDPYGRQNAYAFLRGASPATLILLGHIDTVDTQDYGVLEPWALDPLALASRTEELNLEKTLAAGSDDWLFGRGVIDMKSGVAANIALMRHLARRASETEAPPPISIVLLATPDEENESAGVLQAVRFLLRLREEEGLNYLGAINTDYTTALFPGDTQRYVFSGTVGKLLPSFLCIGRESHVGAAFDGVDANLLSAELIRDLSMNIELCDTVRGQITAPPVTLHAADLKEHYDVQLPFAASFYANVLTFTTGPAELLERLRVLASAAQSRVLQRLDAAELRWRNAEAGTLPQRSGLVLSYSELLATTIERLGEERVRTELATEWERWPATLDKRERSLRLTYRLWSLSGLRGPAVVLSYAPPYYPHVPAATGPLQKAVQAVVEGHREQNLVLREYYPFLSDMSYLHLVEGMDLTGLTANMPVWDDGGFAARPGSYHLPLEEIQRLGIAVVNLGPYGQGAHQREEGALMSYSFGVLPQLLYETYECLAKQTSV